MQEDALAERVAAVERAITDGEADLADIGQEAEALERLEALEQRCDELADAVDELEAATQALRGYVGNVRSVNQRVEERADLALSKVEALEDEGCCEVDASAPDREPTRRQASPVGGKAATDGLGKQTTDGAGPQPHAETTVGPGTDAAVGTCPRCGVAGGGDGDTEPDALGDTGETHRPAVEPATGESRDPWLVEQVRRLL